MTLLVALVCDSFVMQVSDRCLSRGGKPEPGEWNKAVVWCNLASIAYTGNAFRDHRQTKPVDDWIAEAVAPAAATWDVFRNLMGGAEGWLKRSSSVHRQAFSLVGWDLQPDRNHVPYAGLISNFHDEQGALKLATREFTWLRIDRSPRAPHRRFYLGRAGATVRMDEYRSAFRAIKRMLLHSEAADPARAADVLTHLIRLVAKRDPTVGSDVMVTCLPKPVGNNAQFFVTSRSGKPNLQVPTFFYRRLDGDDSVAFGPRTVYGHVVQSIDTVSYLNESGSDAEIRMTFRVLPSHPRYKSRRAGG